MFPARQRWIEDDAGKLAENFDIAMGLHPGGYRPFDLNGIGGIDVVVDHDDLLDAAAGGSAEHGETDVLAETFVGFIDGKDRVQCSSPPRVMCARFTPGSEIWRISSASRGTATMIAEPDGGCPS